MTCLYIYRLTDDTGFAPCVENGLLSLACCKGGQIRNGRFQETKVYQGDIAEKIISECMNYKDGKRHAPTKPIYKSGCK